MPKAKMPMKRKDMPMKKKDMMDEEEEKRKGKKLPPWLDKAKRKKGK